MGLVKFWHLRICESNKLFNELIDGHRTQPSTNHDLFAGVDSLVTPRWVTDRGLDTTVDTY